MELKLKLISGCIIGLVLIVGVSMSAYAATPEQQQALQDAVAKVAEARKELIAVQVEAGILTQEQADRILARIDARLNPPVPAAEQKEKVAEAYQKQIAALKDLINAQVEAGRITPERGAYLIKILDAQAEYLAAVGYNFKDMGKVDRRLNVGRRTLRAQVGQTPRITIRGRQFVLPGLSAPSFPSRRTLTVPRRMGVLRQLPGIKREQTRDKGKDAQDSVPNSGTPSDKKPSLPQTPFTGWFNFGIQKPFFIMPFSK